MPTPKHRKTLSTYKPIKKYEDIFDGKLGMWNITPVYLELREDAKPLFWRHYPEPRVHKAMFIKEVERLVRLGVLEEANDFGWDAYLFAQPKSKTNRVIFISNSWNLNRQLKRKPYTMPRISSILLYGPWVISPIKYYDYNK